MSGGIATSFPSERPSWGVRILPLRPIASGFLYNTIFYAVPLWVLVTGPFALRRFIRTKRGLCVKCGYDLKGAEHEVCPECGTEQANPA